MGKVTGFLELDRQDRKYRPAADRVRNFKEFFIELPEQTLQAQASRCMDCGIPFCHDVKGLKGCPVNNQIPDWNDLVYKGEWKTQLRIYIQPIIFQNLLAEFVQHLAKHHAL